MKLNIIFLSLFFVACSASAKIKLKLEPIAEGKLIYISSSYKLPGIHELNKGAPSKVEVFEKREEKWVSVERVDLNNLNLLSSQANAQIREFQKPVRLTLPKSEIKIEATLYHCPSDHKGICVIDEFEGFVKRTSKKQSPELKLALIGSQP